VFCVELDERAAEAARQVCDQVIVGNLETTTLWQQLGDRTFDVILALDVLEHLQDPVHVLTKAVKHLNSTGIVVVSVPNITHGAIRLSLLQGRFEYADTGLLDRTHLRFFDRRGAERLMIDAGLAILEHLRVSRGLEETEVRFDNDAIAAGVLDQIGRDPDATTYQFVFVGHRQTDPDIRLPSGDSKGTLSEYLLAENEALKKQFAEVEGYARSLESERARLLEATSHGEELAQRVEEAQLRHSELRHCKADLAVKQAFIDDLRNTVEQLNNEVSRLRIEVDSAGYRLMNGLRVRFRQIPVLYVPARRIARALVRRRDR